MKRIQHHNATLANWDDIFPMGLPTIAAVFFGTIFTLMGTLPPFWVPGLLLGPPLLLFAAFSGIAYITYTPTDEEKAYESLEYNAKIGWENLLELPSSQRKALGVSIFDYKDFNTEQRDAFWTKVRKIKDANAKKTRLEQALNAKFPDALRSVDEVLGQLNEDIKAIEGVVNELG